MILYFSGTGNSQFAALRIAKLLGEDKAVSINRCLKDEEKREFHSELPLGFCRAYLCLADAKSRGGMDRAYKI